MTIFKKLVSGAAICLIGLLICNDAFAAQVFVLEPFPAEQYWKVSITFPAEQRAVTRTPAFRWEARLRLFTYPPIWGTDFSNVALKDINWREVQKESGEGNPAAAYIRAHKILKDQALYGYVANELMVAAKQGLPEAENDLGVLYLFGFGVSRDTRLGVQYIKSAAYKGVTTAEVNLGFLTAFGIETPQNWRTAESLFLKAAGKGSPVANALLAASMARGTDLTRQDLRKAYRHILLARAYGSNWPLEDRSSRSYLYFVDLGNLEAAISARLTAEERRGLQRQLSTLTRPSQEPSWTIKSWVENSRPKSSEVLVIGPPQ